MHKIMILPACLGILLVGIVMVPGVFAEPNLGYLDLDSQESIIFEGTYGNVLRITVIATNNGNEEISNYYFNPYLHSGGSIYEKSYYIQLDGYGVGQEDCPISIPKIPAGLTREIILCFEIKELPYILLIRLFL